MTKKLLNRCRWAAMWGLCLGMAFTANAVEIKYSPYEVWFSGGSYADYFSSTVDLVNNSEDNGTGYAKFLAQDKDHITLTGVTLIKLVTPANRIQLSLKGSHSGGKLVVDEFEEDPQGNDKATPLNSRSFPVSETEESAVYTLITAGAVGQLTAWLRLSWSLSEGEYSYGEEYTQRINLKLSREVSSIGDEGGGWWNQYPGIYFMVVSAGWQNVGSHWRKTESVGKHEFRHGKRNDTFVCPWRQKGDGIGG